MKKRIVLFLVLVAFVAGMAFGQDGDRPLNSVGLDIGPVIVGTAFGIASKSIFSGKDVKPWGFGIALQYERLILPSFSVGLKGGYLGFGLGMSQTYSEKDPTTGIIGEAKANIEVSLNSINIEAHGRWYPGSNVLFLDGMLGYGNFSAALKGEMAAKVTDANGNVITDPTTGNPLEEGRSITTTIPRSYFTYGAKIGWRIIAGSGFTFEPSVGYYGAVGIGDTLGKGIAKKIGGDTDTKALDDAMKILENFVFFGGPRLALVFGWSF